MAVVTRLGLYGGPRSLYGSFAGKVDEGAFVSIGGTSQIGNYSSSGGITLERVIGGTSQIGNYASSGGITLERVIGGTSQLSAYSSSGGITVGEAVAVAATSGGASPRRRQRQFLNLNGKLIEVASYKEAVSLYQHLTKTKVKPKRRKIRLKIGSKPYVTIFDMPTSPMPVKKVHELLDKSFEDEEMMLLLLLAA